MCRWLASCGVDRFTAHIHARHTASQRVARALGMSASDVIDDDGEVVWVSEVPDAAG
jgi:RimJ/RimL family protein N-acetyltransferase